VGGSVGSLRGLNRVCGFGGTTEVVPFSFLGLSIEDFPSVNSDEERLRPFSPLHYLRYL
jgi:hypothetical protein